MVKYIPKRGDIVWIQFDPQKGKEIQKNRPALVVSPKEYNEKVGLALFMQITSHIRGYPFEVLLEEPSSLKGVVLCDQLRSLDWKARKAEYITEVPTQIMRDIIDKFKVLIE